MFDMGKQSQKERTVKGDVHLGQELLGNGDRRVCVTWGSSFDA